MLLVYRLLEGVNEERRRIIASVCGLWWSVLFADLFLNNREWNPSSIPFFMLCFVLLLTEQHRQPRLAVKAGMWIAIGICLAILESLHGSTLLVMPVVFLGVTAFDISRRARDPRRWIAPFVSLLIMALCLTPYWAGEATRGWANSRAFVSSIFAHGSAAPTLLIRLNTVRAAWTSMSEQVFFVDGGPWLKLAGIGVLVALPIFAVLLRFRGDRRLLAILVFHGPSISTLRRTIILIQTISITSCRYCSCRSFLPRSSRRGSMEVGAAEPASHCWPAGSRFPSF